MWKAIIKYFISVSVHRIDVHLNASCLLTCLLMQTSAYNIQIRISLLNLSIRALTGIECGREDSRVRLVVNETADTLRTCHG